MCSFEALNVFLPSLGGVFFITVGSHADVSDKRVRRERAGRRPDPPGH